MDNGAALQQQSNTIGTDNLAQYILNLRSQFLQERLGGGPGIFLHDSSMLPNNRLRDLVMDTAREIDQPLQFNVLSGYGQDGAMIQKTHGGVPAINITVPTRYLHSHTGVIHRNDVAGAIRLVAEVVRRLDAETVARLRSFD